jgi:predicted dehydrogenase
MEAGKHVYCEAPLSSNLEECHTIARAAQAAKPVFQVGQQFRGNPIHQHVRKFVEAGVLDKIVQVRAQRHKRESWRRPAPTPEREREVNWRLDPAVSAGLMGEIGLHQIDTVNWFLGQLPQAVSGFGGVLAWADGREVADTVQCVFEYPNGLRVLYEATLANSFDGAYELLLGTQGTILLRGLRGWLFKEADSPLLGWEVYAKKEQLVNETGIVLIANATKLIEQGKDPAEAAVVEEGKDELYYSVESFLTAIRKGEKPVCTVEDGLRAAVVALQANEAVRTGTRIVYEPAWFEV